MSSPTIWRVSSSHLFNFSFRRLVRRTAKRHGVKAEVLGNQGVSRYFVVEGPNSAAFIQDLMLNVGNSVISAYRDGREQTLWSWEVPSDG